MEILEFSYDENRRAQFQIEERKPNGEIILIPLTPYLTQNDFYPILNGRLRTKVEGSKIYLSPRLKVPFQVKNLVPPTVQPHLGSHVQIIYDDSVGFGSNRIIFNGKVICRNALTGMFIVEGRTNYDYVQKFRFEPREFGNYFVLNAQTRKPIPGILQITIQS